jgi:adenylate cyclase
MPAFVIAEVELGSEDDAPVVPEWAGREITEDRRYYNAALARLPFTRWT